MQPKCNKQSHRLHPNLHFNYSQDLGTKCIGTGTSTITLKEHQEQIKGRGDSIHTGEKSLHLFHFDFN